MQSAIIAWKKTWLNRTANFKSVIETVMQIQLRFLDLFSAPNPSNFSIFAYIRFESATNVMSPLDKFMPNSFLSFYLSFG